MKTQLTLVALLFTSLLALPAFAYSEAEKTLCGTVKTSNGPTLMGSHGPTSQVKHSFKVDGIKGAFAFSLELGENHEDDGKRWPTDEVERNARIERNKREALRHNNARAFEEQIIIKASHVREVCLTGTFGLNDDGTAGWVAPQELNAPSEKADLEETAGENESAAL